MFINETQTVRIVVLPYIGGCEKMPAFCSWSVYRPLPWWSLEKDHQGKVDYWWRRVPLHCWSVGRTLLTLLVIGKNAPLQIAEEIIDVSCKLSEGHYLLITQRTSLMEPWVFMGPWLRRTVIIPEINVYF